MKAATGEVVTAEELGGGDVHTRISGVADHLARERRARAGDRAAHRRQPQSAQAVGARGAGRRPIRCTTPTSCTASMPSDTRKPYDVREVIARIVDGSRARRVQAALRHDARHRLRAHPRLSGRHRRQQRHPVLGVGAEGRALHRAVRAARHSARCSCRTSRASWSGANTSTSGIARDGAKMVTAVACANVPKFTVIIGGSFGAGNYGMCGRAYGPALPVDVAERAHLGHGRRAGGVGARDGAPRRHEAQGKAWSKEDEEAFKAPIRAQYETQGHPYYATARLWDDGVIDPAQTRRVLGLALSAVAQRADREDAVRRVPDVGGMFAQDPHRQPRRDRLPRHQDRAPPGHAHGRRVFRRRRAMRVTRGSPTRRCCIGPPPARESYLRIDAHHRRGRSRPAREAIHPGLRLPVRERGVRRGVRSERRSSSSARRRGDPRHGQQERREGADGEGRRAAGARLPRRRPGRDAAAERGRRASAIRC